VWGVERIPSEVGLSSDEIFAAVGADQIHALVVGGVDPHDAGNIHAALAALKSAFVVSLEIRPSEVTKIADVVLPVAAVPEKSGSFMNWEGRTRSFEVAVPDSLNRSDVRILTMISEELGRSIALPSVKSSAAEMASFGDWDGTKSEFTPVASAKSEKLGTNQALLTSWRRLLDEGSLQEGEDNLAGTARKTVVVISPKRATSLGVVDGDAVRVSNANGAIVLPVLVEAIHDDAVWLPRNSRGSHLLATLGVASGSLVTVVKD
jgi:NADH-quinone oxidoreductase subunit G